MDDWVVSCRVDESCHVGRPARRGLALGVFLPLKPYAVLV
jgi:hypothetical protein